MEPPKETQVVEESLDAQQPDPLRALLIANSQWVEGVIRFQPNFFRNSALSQAPKILWLGCSDSRVPESVITMARPGNIFVHRNIANRIQDNDTNFLSVLQFSVDAVRVKHVIVVGHSQCGAAEASFDAVARHESLERPIQTVHSHPAEAPINRWLEPLTELADSLGLSSVERPEAVATLVDENVKGQVINLGNTKTIQDAWSRARNPIPEQLSEESLGQGRVSIHGWVYELETGFLRDLNVSQNWES